MNDTRKTKAQLLRDLAAVRQRLARLEAERLGAADPGPTQSTSAVQECDPRWRAVEARMRALAESEARLRTMVEAADDGLLTLSEHGIVEACNPAVERLFGYAAAEVLDHHVARLMPLMSRAAYAAALARARRTGAPQLLGQSREVVGQRKDGSIFPLELRLRAVRLGDRHLFTGCVRDLTARAPLEATGRQTEQLMLVGRLAVGVFHELRAPLNTIFLQADLLAEEVRQPSSDSQTQIAASVADIKTEITRLAELIQDYLSLARLASLQRTAVELGPLVQAWAQEMRELCTNRRIRLTLRGLSGLGQVACHSSSLRRAVRNLMQNALEAMPQGGTLTLRGWRTAAHVHLEISDTGIGMAQDQLAWLFEPLRTTKPEGTGLGLYLVQEIVAAHEGRIAVRSAPEQGTTFTITLPQAAEQAAHT